MTTTYEYNYEIGTTALNMVNVESLVEGTRQMPAPEGIYHPYVEGIDTENGDIVALGLPTVEWNFPYLERAQRDALRAYCTGPSATVFIKTRGNDSADTFVKLTGKMIWPQTEERESAGKRVNFKLIFIQMESFT
jgi:hypothetical protein